MKRQWLYLGIIIATIVQLSVDWIIYPLLIGNFGMIQHMQPKLLYIVLAETAFAGIVGFVYLHVPNAKRGLAAGATIGGILGMLIAVYQGSILYGLYTVSSEAVYAEGIKTIILAVLCGFVISAVELKMNRGTISSVREK